ncbi:colanic acid biosynthesis glycosyltransferase WcaL [Sphingobium lactosutens]|nr:colanic acid biosynthesis glycosyltransferase WcaL [Sphingobium lactosutens]
MKAPRVAYLTNVYPKPSHSFIRREIFALERQGFEVARLSVREGADALPDPADRSEQDRTRILLNGNYLELLAAFLSRVWREPRRLWRGIGTAHRMLAAGMVGPVRICAYLLEACLLVEYLERAGIRHVHVHFGTNPAAVARIACDLSNVTYSVTLHGPDEFDEPKSLQLSEKVSGAAFVVAISSFCRGQLIRWTHAQDWAKIKVVRCGIELERIDDDVDIAPDISPLSNRLVCVARLSAQKGLALLLEAAAEVAPLRRFELRIIGDGELRPMLEEQIERLGLRHHVTLLGWCSAETVREEMMQARALVLPSLAEGLPIVLMEAMALGKPVVASCISGIPELVDDHCGYLVPAGSTEAITETLHIVLEADRETLAVMGEAGRARVRRYHDVDRNAAALAALFRPLV